MSNACSRPPATHEFLEKCFRPLLWITGIAFSTLASAQTCTISVSGVNFGNYNPVSGSAEVLNAMLIVNCPSGTAYYLNLNDGAYSSSGFQNNMGSGSNRLPYTLSRVASPPTKWGNSFNLDGESGTGTGTNQTLTMYPQIAAYQTGVPASYTDTITATLRKGDNSGTLASTTFSVTATIIPGCVVSATNLNFGTFTGVQSTASTTLSELCTKTTTYNIGVNSGLNYGSGNYNWKMLGPSGALLHYTLWRNSGYTQSWGGTVGTDTLAGTGNGATQSVPMYGLIPGGQYVTPGSYSDTVIVTLTY